MCSHEGLQIQAAFGYHLHSYYLNRKSMLIYFVVFSDQVCKKENIETNARVGIKQQEHWQKITLGY